MGVILDHQSIQCLNLFAKISGVHTKDSFMYNHTRIFVVKPRLLSKAVGERGRNVRRLSTMLRTRIRVIPLSNLGIFVREIVQPIRFKKLLIEDNKVTIFAGQQSKASLIGRNKTKLLELAEILKTYFGIKQLRII